MFNFIDIGLYSQSALYQVTYNPLHLALAVFIAITGAYSAMYVSNKMFKLPQIKKKIVWAVLGGLSFGISIWLMHFITLLSLEINSGLHYDISKTILSAIPILICGGLAIYVIGTKKKSALSVMVASMALGVGVMAVNYIGSSAMMIDGNIKYDYKIFSISIVIAMLLSYISIRVRSFMELFLSEQYSDIASSVIMGGSIFIMQWVASLATVYEIGDKIDHSIIISNDFLTISVIIATTLLGGTLFLISMAFKNDTLDEVKASEERWKMALDTAHQGVWDWDMKSGHVFLSDQAKDILCLGADGLKSWEKDWRKSIYPEDLKVLLSDLDNHIKGLSGSHMVEHRIKSMTGNGNILWKWVLSHGLLVKKDEFGNPERMIGTFTDINDRKLNELKIQEDQKTLLERDIKLSALYNNNAVGIISFNKNGFIEELNTKCEDILKYIKSDIMGSRISTIIPDISEGQLAEYERIQLWIPKNLTLKTTRRDSKPISINMYLDRVNYEGYEGYVGFITDITDRLEAENKINNLAFYDQATKLPNRTSFVKDLESSMKKSGTPLYSALIEIDIDNIKTLNDIYGHQKGDCLILEISKKINEIAQPKNLIIYRIDGDEFSILIKNIDEDFKKSFNYASEIANNILNHTAGKYTIEGISYNSSVSIGVYLYIPEETLAAETVIKSATSALHIAKQKHNTVCFFDPKIQSYIERKVDMEFRLRSAIQNTEFTLYYQPQTSCTGQILGAEALLRWDNNTIGKISPVEFIPIAESSGLIIQIGDWVIENVCKTISDMCKQLPISIPIAVNVSGYQFYQDDFVEKLLLIVAKENIRPELLKLELTESMIMEDISLAVNKMNRLKELGFKLSLDDFGTGYSSLGYLKNFPFNQIKMDKSFIHNVKDDTADMKIIESIVNIGNVLGMSVVAEGVETETELMVLKKLNCPIYQGYYFSKPITKNDLFIYITKNQ